MDDKKTAAQRRREELEYVTGCWLKEHGVDAASLITITKEIVMTCVDEGFVSQKVNAKSDVPMDVIERFPGIAIQGISLIHKIITDCQRELDKTPPPDPTINIVLSRKRLEDIS